MFFLFSKIFYLDSTSKLLQIHNFPSKAFPVESRISLIDGKYLAFGILFIWYLLAASMATMPAYVPDEAWFFYEALRSSKDVKDNGAWFSELFFHHNNFGYGSFWWAIYIFLALVWDGILGFLSMPTTSIMLTIDPGFGKVMLWENASAFIVAPMVMMRIVSLSLLACFGFVLIRNARTVASELLAIIILVTMPIAWWSGKIASPELFATALFSIAVARWFHSSNILSNLLIASVAVGIKLTIAPVYIVFVCFVFFDAQKNHGFNCRFFFKLTGLCLLAILFCNSWIFCDPKSGIEQLLQISHSYRPHPDLKFQSDLILWMKSEFWEGSNYGSLSYWAGSFITLAAAFIIACLENKRLAAFLFACALAQYFFMMTQPPHGWYWFPVVLSAIIPFNQLGTKGAIIAGGVLLSLLYPFENAKHELSYKQMHLRELDQVKIQRHCIMEKLANIQPNVVYDMSAIGTFISSAPQHNWRAFNYHDSFVALIISPKPTAIGKKQILLLGERTEINFGLPLLHKQNPNKIIDQCGTIKIVNVES